MVCNHPHKLGKSWSFGASGANCRGENKSGTKVSTSGSDDGWLMPTLNGSEQRD